MPTIQQVLQTELGRIEAISKDFSIQAEWIRRHLACGSVWLAENDARLREEFKHLIPTPTAVDVSPVDVMPKPLVFEVSQAVEHAPAPGPVVTREDTLYAPPSNLGYKTAGYDLTE